MQKNLYKVDTKWLKAAVLGSIWASFEIVFGSFLHNMRFPLSGTILTIIAGILIIIFATIWHENGIIWRSALIAALMKSISPSSILFGPMIAIFLEGIIFEFFIYIFGKNWFAYTLASVSNLYSVLIHKLVTLLVLYGWNLVLISKNLYYFVLKQLNIQNVSFKEAFLWLSGFYVMLGVFTALVGIYFAQRVKDSEKFFSKKIEIKRKNISFLSADDQKRTSVFVLFIVIVYLIIGFFITTSDNLLYSTIVTLALLIFAFFRYSAAMKRLKKPAIWIQAIILFISSAIFYEIKSEKIVNIQGIIAGVNMIYRMIILITGFSIISMEMRNPVIRSLLYRHGMRNVYMAIGLGFSILPEILKKSLDFKKFIKHPLNVFVEMISTAKNINNYIETIELNRRAIIISGEVTSGKTTFAVRLVDELQKRDVNVCGFYAKGYFENGKRSKFELIDILNGERILLASTEKISDFKTGRFYFNPLAFKKGSEIVKKCIDKNSRIILIDEVGRLEYNQKGWYELIEKIFENKDILQIWTVRKRYLDRIIRTFGLTEVCFVDLEKDTPQKTAEIITETIISDFSKHIS